MKGRTCPCHQDTEEKSGLCKFKRTFYVNRNEKYHYRHQPLGWWSLKLSQNRSRSQPLLCQSVSRIWYLQNISTEYLLLLSDCWVRGLLLPPGVGVPSLTTLSVLARPHSLLAISCLCQLPPGTDHQTFNHILTLWTTLVRKILASEEEQPVHC